VSFNIPANTPNGTLYVGIAICGDATIEPNEQIFVNLIKNAAEAVIG
jgi:hypothetical protein